jgi:L-cysteine desulfidase
MVYQAYMRILQDELVPAMGCTEPIAVAYCAAKTREALAALPDRVELEVSGNIIKNVKSVVVPHTGGKRGMRAAVAAGIIAGDPTRELEVISSVSPSQIEELERYLQNTDIIVRPADTKRVLDIFVTAWKGQDWAKVHIADHHTNIVRIEKNGNILFDSNYGPKENQIATDLEQLTVERIFDFANTLNTDDVQEIFDRQMAYNSAIAQEGLRGNYGASVGKTLLCTQGHNVRTRARAMAAAGSDARMNGCELPVIINSGSGNQGMTVSLPVIEYAKELGRDQETLYRALAISNLVAIHLKSGIGRLSAYCGAISAGVGAGAAICYLYGGTLEDISHTIVNALAISSGVICDGAKASCAAKISLAVDTGIFGYEMFCNGQQFYSGDGIVSKGVENTIHNISILGKEGMAETDKIILSIMVNS